MTSNQFFHHSEILSLDQTVPYMKVTYLRRGMAPEVSLNLFPKIEVSEYLLLEKGHFGTLHIVTVFPLA